MIKIKNKNINLDRLYNEKRNLCESQNHYMNKFIRNKQWSFKELRDQQISLHYTSIFDEIKKDIYQLSKKNSFYVSDIYSLFIKDSKHMKLITQDYHCLYLKKEFDVIGFILFTTDQKEIILQFILVDPQFRGKNLGSLLINMVEICIYYLRNTGLLKYKNGIISAYTYSPIMTRILEKHNYVKQIEHDNPNLQDHDYFRKSFL
jgi:GNAT superfamily N-acetyltransferase